MKNFKENRMTPQNTSQNDDAVSGEHKIMEHAAEIRCLLLNDPARCATIIHTLRSNNENHVFKVKETDALTSGGERLFHKAIRKVLIAQEKMGVHYENNDALLDAVISTLQSMVAERRANAQPRQGEAASR